jgi:hypothetical protein
MPGLGMLMRASRGIKKGSSIGRSSSSLKITSQISNSKKQFSQPLKPVRQHSRQRPQQPLQQQRPQQPLQQQRPQQPLQQQRPQQPLQQQRPQQPLQQQRPQQLSSKASQKNNKISNQESEDYLNMPSYSNIPSDELNKQEYQEEYPQEYINNPNSSNLVLPSQLLNQELNLKKKSQYSMSNNIDLPIQYSNQILKKSTKKIQESPTIINPDFLIHASDLSLDLMITQLINEKKRRDKI